MYNGVDKYGGTVVGHRQEETAPPSSNLEDIIDTASAEETLQVAVPSYDDDGNVIPNKSSIALLSAQLNPSGGGLMWIEQENTTNKFNSVVASSQMTSMLRDTDRNSKYGTGIRAAITEFRSKFNRDPVVLDIGTGTGLLAMLAADTGASKVIACEMFPTMAAIASDVTKLNFPSGIITVVAKPSTELVKGFDGIPSDGVDIIVSEILDSVLIGEGVIPTLRHAREHLLKPSFSNVIVPSHATLWGQVVECPMLLKFHQFPHPDANLSISFSRNAKCSGGRVALPLHMSHVKDYKALTDPFVAFDFDFNGDIKPRIKTLNDLKVINAGVPQVVVFYWTLDLFNNKASHYSTKSGEENWQDHWVQAVYPLEHNNTCVTESISLTVGHDDYNVWADRNILSPSKECTCGNHVLYNAERLAQLNDSDRNGAYHSAMTSALNLFENPTCLDVSDGSYCALLAATIGCNAVTSVESKAFSYLMSSQLVTCNSLHDSVVVWECGVTGLRLEHLASERKVDVLAAEPFYFSMQSLVVWQALNFWLRRTAVSDLLHLKTVILPACARVKVAVVAFDNLATACYGKNGVVSGFDHSPLDEVQDRHYESRDFPYPLWMYSHKVVSAVEDLWLMDFTTPLTTSVFESVTLKKTNENATAHAVICWVDWQLDVDGKHIVSTGPNECVHSKQTIRFLPEEKRNDTTWQSVNASVSFSIEDGKLDFNYNIV